MSILGVIGDMHLGASFNLGHTDPTTQLNSRLLDFLASFDAILNSFEQHEVQVVAITGDVFDVRNPSPSVVSAFSRCIKQIIDRGLEVVLIAGNHDQQRTINTTTIDFLKHLHLPGVHVFSEMGVQAFSDFNLLLMPYMDRKMLQASSNEEAVEEVKAKIIQHIKGLRGPVIAVGHSMLENPASGVYGENFSMNELVLPIDTFSKCDAVLMGHIHLGEVLRERDPVALYVGSMERITFGDKGQNKRCVVLDTNNPTAFKSIDTPTRNLFELSFDYSAEKPLKVGVNDRIIADIDAFTAANDVKGSITRIVVKLKESDVYYVNQERVRARILEAGVDSLVSVQCVSTTSRQLRDDTIDEKQNSKKAFAAFIKNLAEPDSLKKKLLKAGDQIIEEIDGK